MAILSWKRKPIRTRSDVIKLCAPLCARRQNHSRVSRPSGKVSDYFNLICVANPPTVDYIPYNASHRFLAGCSPYTSNAASKPGLKKQKQTLRLYLEHF